MAKKITSWSQLEKSISALNDKAMKETVAETLVDAQINVSHFYDSEEGRYKRTGRLKSSPDSEINGTGMTASGEVYLDTDYTYKPSGRDTQTIYGYAEDGGLLGNGGFWEATKQDAKKNINKIYGKYF